MRTFAALLEFGLGSALLCFGIAHCFVHAAPLDDWTSLAARIFWAWAGMFWFGLITLATIEAIFHTLGVPL